jgi:hypothetical protein
VAGAVLLLRSAIPGRSVGELVLVVGLVAMPAASDAIVWSFHPQDLMSVGFACAGISQVLHRRWVAVGALFGLAVLCKQFALLPLLAVLAAAPHWRARARILVPALSVVALGVLPFYVADPVATLRELTAVSVKGIGVKTPTIVGSLGAPKTLKLEIARDAPPLASAFLALWAWRRARGRLLTPAPAIGLACACLGTRLLFEVENFNYYFLAVGVFLLVLDLVLERPPLWSVGWIVATRFGVTAFGAPGPSWLTASTFLVAALVPVVLGLAQVPPSDPPVLATRSDSRTRAVDQRSTALGRHINP